MAASNPKLMSCINGFIRGKTASLYLPQAQNARNYITNCPLLTKRVKRHEQSGMRQSDTFLSKSVLAINFNPLAFMTSSRESTILEDKCLDTF
jgi:hypothetical protein